MKTKIISYLAITLISITSLFTVKVMADGNYRISLVEENSQDSYDKKILLAKKIAIQRLAAYIKNPVSNYSSDAEAHKTLDNMLAGLKNAKIYKVKPEYASDTDCADDADFYTGADNNIRICPSASGYSADAIAQRIDHEALHIGWNLMGIHIDRNNRNDIVESEAYALSYEFAITRNTNKDQCIYVRTGYEHEADIMSYLSQHDVGIPPVCNGSRDTNYGIASNQ